MLPLTKTPSPRLSHGGKGSEDFRIKGNLGRDKGSWAAKQQTTRLWSVDTQLQNQNSTLWHSHYCSRVHVEHWDTPWQLDLLQVIQTPVCRQELHFSPGPSPTLEQRQWQAF